MKTVMGRNGFLGSEIWNELKLRGNQLNTLPDKNSESIFYFGAPSSVILFNKNLDYCMRETIDSFLSLASLCKQNDIYLVYASSATVNNKNNSYARCKAILEEIHHAYGLKALGLRISAAYGPGEEHKGEYASIIYQWCKLMKNGERPTIWGDGTQTRDFIYIDDVIDTIMAMSENGVTGIHEIGTGINTSFNDVIATINKVLGTNIEPIYIKKPFDYIQDTPVKAVRINTSLEGGIRKILATL